MKSKPQYYASIAPSGCAVFAFQSLIWKLEIASHQQTVLSALAKLHQVHTSRSSVLST